MLFPHLAQVAVERVFVAGRSVRIQGSTRGRQAACPACGRLSARVHSRYQRWLSDTAVGGQETVIQLSVRRFFCPSTACKKVTFAEQVPELTVWYGRRSTGLTRMLRAVALALGGRAGARLTGALAAEVSRMTLMERHPPRSRSRRSGGKSPSAGMPSEPDRNWLFWALEPAHGRGDARASIRRSVARA